MRHSVILVRNGKHLVSVEYNLEQTQEARLKLSWSS